MQLNFPSYNFNIKRQQNANYVFDIIRKKFVVLTPEEWVRQHLIHYLIEEKGYPASLLAIERGLEVNGLKKRFDVLAFDSQGKPIMLVECKAPEIEINPKTLLQVSVYNSQFKCKHILITNGLHHVYLTFNNQNESSYQEQIPAYIELD